MNYLILVRHGESRWNLANKFTGWVDVPLSEKGIEEAIQCGDRLENLELDIAFASKLERSQATLLLILAQQYFTGYFVHEEKSKFKKRYTSENFSKDDIPIYTNEALNERYYGQLQGVNKAAAKKKYGEKQVLAWRRHYQDRPPGGESLKDTYQRAVPYFRNKVMPFIKNKRNVIVSAHGNTLRAPCPA